MFNVNTIVHQVILRTRHHHRLVQRIPVARRPQTSLFTTSTRRVLLSVTITRIQISLRIATSRQGIQQRRIHRRRVARIIRRTNRMNRTNFKTLNTQRNTNRTFSSNNNMSQLLPMQHNILQVVLKRTRNFTRNRARHRIGRRVGARRTSSHILRQAGLTQQDMVQQHHPARRLHNRHQVNFSRTDSIVGHHIKVSPRFSSFLYNFNRQKGLSNYFRALLSTPHNRYLGNLNSFLTIVIQTIRIKTSTNRIFTRVNNTHLNRRHLRDITNSFRRRIQLTQISRRLQLTRRAFFMRAQ